MPRCARHLLALLLTFAIAGPAAAVPLGPEHDGFVALTAPQDGGSPFTDGATSGPDPFEPTGAPPPGLDPSELLLAPASDVSGGPPAWPPSRGKDPLELAPPGDGIESAPQVPEELR